tara:strand:- start:1197 stop:2513 length:1317 start_codon:yes stop_codon:yes gene_type:complete
MAATTSQLGLVTPTQGDLTGTWGNVVNNGITEYTNIAIAATLTLTGDGAVTLANTTGNSSATNITSTLSGAGTVTAQFAIVKISGTLTTTKVVTFGSSGSAPYSKTYTVVNAATGGSVSFIAYGGTGVTIAVGESAYVYFDGTNIVKVSSTAVSGVLPVANGGTGLASGTSGGVLAYTASGTLASSAALTQYGVVYGGGAGAVPVATANGTTGQAFVATTGGAPSWGIAGPAGGGTGVANNAASTLTISGSYASTFTVSGAYNYSFPGATSTLAALGVAQSFSAVQTIPNITLPTNGQILHTVPTSDGQATGPTINAFNCGYSSSAVGDLVYLDSSSTWQKCNAGSTVLLYSGLLGIALEVKASGAALLVALPGSFVYAVAAFPTFTIGSPIYMSAATAGAVTQTAPSATNNAVRVVGWGVHADKMYFFPSPDYITRT